MAAHLNPPPLNNDRVAGLIAQANNAQPVPAPVRRARARRYLERRALLAGVLDGGQGGVSSSGLEAAVKSAVLGTKQGAILGKGTSLKLLLKGFAKLMAGARYSLAAPDLAISAVTCGGIGGLLAGVRASIDELTAVFEGRKTWKEALGAGALKTLIGGLTAACVGLTVHVVLACLPFAFPVVLVLAGFFGFKYVKGLCGAIKRCRQAYREYRQRAQVDPVDVPDFGQYERLLECPVTKEPMLDPILLSTGHTISRAAFHVMKARAIEANRCFQCPMTRAPVEWVCTNTGVLQFALTHSDVAFPRVLRDADDGDAPGDNEDIALTMWADPEGNTHAEPGPGRVRNWSLEALAELNQAIAADDEQGGGPADPAVPAVVPP